MGLWKEELDFKTFFKVSRNQVYDLLVFLDFEYLVCRFGKVFL